jgi:hypothetical protein
MLTTGLSASGIFNANEPVLCPPHSLNSFKRCGEEMQAAASGPNYDEKSCPHKLRLYEMVRTMLLAGVNPTAFLKPLFEAHENGQPTKIDWLWSHFGNAYIMDRTIQEWSDAFAAGNGESVLFNDVDCEEYLSDSEYEDSDDESETYSSSDYELVPMGMDSVFEPKNVNVVSHEHHAEPPIENTFLGPFSEVPFGSEESDDESGAYNNDPGKQTWPPDTLQVSTVPLTMSFVSTGLEPVGNAVNPSHDGGVGRGLLSHAAAIAYVDSLQRIELSTIAVNDRRCPFCWGVYGEDGGWKPIAPAPNASSPINPVRTACGHMFHHGCLMEVVEKSSKDCPLCNTELYSGSA